jgi:membrane protease YdiL (CAAX protease family)
MMKHSLSIRSANRLYLVTILMVIVFGSWMQSASLGWGLLGTEALLIMAPALFFVLRARLPVRQALRLNPISLEVGLAALLIGTGAWLIDALISGIMAQVTGYSVSLGPEALPANAFDAVLIALGFCLAAPICEEILFRGAILGAYQAERSGRAAVILTSLMFAFYHLQLQGFVALLLISFMVSYIAWRANSLYASILVHFANNALATFVLIIYAFRPDVTLPFPSLPAAGIGILLVVGGVLWLNRLTARPADAQPAPAAEVHRPAWWVQYWPLLAGAAVYVVMAGVEVVTFARPELTAQAGLPLSAPAAWDQPASLTYEVRNKANEPVGEMTCQRAPTAETYNLACQAQIKAYQVVVGGGTWMSSGARMKIVARWAKPGLNLVSMDGQMDFNSGGWHTWQVSPANGPLSLALKDDSGKEQSKMLPAGALVRFEWPLRLMAANLQNAQAYRVDLASQMDFRPETQDSGPVVKPAVLVVRGAEKIGQVTAWRVTVDKVTLWYAVAEPHTLLKYDDGFEIYYLK